MPFPAPYPDLLSPDFGLGGALASAGHWPRRGTGLGVRRGAAGVSDHRRAAAIGLLTGNG